jgi:hypothetical protein
VALTVTVCCEVTVVGAVYKPLLLILPVPLGVMLHVTEVFASAVTVALNCCVPVCPSVAVPGDTVTVPGGFSVTVAVADLLVSATLVARTVTLCCVVIEAGAVYNPLALIVPLPAGVMLQVTLLLARPVTVAVNCCVPFSDSVTLVGDTDTGTRNVTVAVADLLVSATLVARTVTVC